MSGRYIRIVLFSLVAALTACSPVGFSANSEGAKVCGGGPDCNTNQNTDPSPSPSSTPGTPSPSPTPGTPSPSPTPGTPSPSPTPGTPSPSPTPGTPSPSPTPGTPSPSPSPSPTTGTGSFTWVSGDWTTCTKACGSGSQTRTVTCQNLSGTVVPDSTCTGTKPATSQICNMQACASTYTWNVAAWGACNATCGGGQQSRVVICQNASGATQLDSLCSQPKPAIVQACNTTACPIEYTWYISAWGACSRTCEGGTQTRTVQCQTASGVASSDAQCSQPKPSTQQTCNTQSCGYTYAWVTGGWGACSVTCGGGQQSRSVACQRSDGQYVDGSYCAATVATPAASQACNTAACPVTSRPVSEQKYVTPSQSQVDILLVLDDSLSMSYDNPKLAAKMGTLVSGLSASGIDWRMCVTSTDTAYYGGRPIQWTGTGTHILTPAQGNLQWVFDQTVADITARIGTTDERGINAMNLSLANNPTYQCFRPNAALSVILISDEDERSVGGHAEWTLNGEQYQPMEYADTPDSFIQNVYNTFGTNKRFTVNSIVVKDSTCEASQDAQGSPSFWGLNYMDLSNRTGGYIGSICDADYSSNVQYFKERIQNSLETMQLQCQPVGNAVNVSVSPAVSNLSYSLQGTVLRFNPVLPEGRTVTLNYNCPL